MLHYRVLLPLIFCSLSAPLSAQRAPSLLERPNGKPRIVIQNRVLAKVNQKPITVLDLVKKMDFVFYRQFPDYSNAPEMRYQFYMINWRAVLSEMVDKELMLADAEDVKVTIPDGDVRKELEEFFGPNIVMNLDKAGLTMDEAKKMIQGESILRRMMYLRVHSKVQSYVTPQEIRKAYDEFLKSYVRSDEWRFHVITLKDPREIELLQFAKSSATYLNEHQVPVDDASFAIKRTPGYGLFTNVKVSDLMIQKESDLSDNYRQILTSLSPGSYSEPLSIHKTEEGVKQVKIFYLDEVKIDEYPSFHEKALELKNALSQKHSEREMKEYKQRLRKQFPCYIVDSSEFSPFSLEVDGKKVMLQPPPPRHE